MRNRIRQCKGLVLPILVASAVLAFVTTAASGAESTFHDCSRDGINRTVELRSEGSSGVPCTIFYHRRQEGVPSRLMWKAQSDPDFCSDKLSGFLIKLKNKLNWSCNARAQEPAVEPIVSEPVVSPIDPGDSDNAKVEVAEEPELAAALPQKPGTTLIARPRAKDENREGSGLTIEILRRLFPPGFYTADNQSRTVETTDGCPGAGYFVWNTRDRYRPVFEMGRQFEFYFSLEEGVVEQPQRLRTDQRETCPISLTSGHCGLRQGDELTLRYEDNLSCEMLGLEEFNRDEAGLVLIARRSSVNAERCLPDNPTGLYALSALPVSSIESSYPPSSVIQLSVQPAVGSGQAPGKESPGLTCRYIYGKTTPAGNQ